MSGQISVSTQVASYLLDIAAIKINLNNPFTWASGWKSPIYCDNRISLSYPDVRTYIKEALINTINDKFSKTEAIAGVATAGIPQGAIVANELKLPFLYVRTQPKGHGLSKQIEGRIIADQKIVVIEDLVSTGGSSMKAIEALRKVSADVLGMVSVFTYGFKQSYDLFEKENIAYYPLSDYNSLLNVAMNQGYIKPDELSKLKAWKENPASWN